jgi:hypothetical protein
MKLFQLGIVGCIVSLGCSVYAQQVETLSDAPVPAPTIGTSSQNHAVTAKKYAKYIDSGQQAQPLRGKDKIVLSFAEQVQPWAFATQLLSAGWEHLADANPRYGSDMAGFGERLGAAALRQNSHAILSDGLVAAAFHEDPRYYRMGDDNKFSSRLWYAPSRVFITRTDKGKQSVNFAKLIGYAGASSLSKTYYPAVSADWGEIWKGYGISLAGSALGNILHEFIPDPLHHLHHKSP